MWVALLDEVNLDVQGAVGPRTRVTPDRWRLLRGAMATAGAVLAVWVLLVVARSWPNSLFTYDFVSFWTGASLVREGAGPALFDMETQRGFQVDLRSQLATSDNLRLATVHNPYHSPPPLALLFVPLTWLPMTWAYLVWTVINLAAFLAAVALPLRRSGHGRGSALIMLTYTGVLSSLVEGQVNSLFLLALSLALTALERGRRFTGGMVLGLLWLKPQYMVLFPIVLLMKRRWVELAGVAVAGLVLAVVSILMVGVSGILQYAEVLHRIGAFYPPPEALISADKMANWRALLMNLWPSISEETGSLLVVILGAATVLGSLLVWRGRWEPTSRRFACQMLATTMATLIAAPHSHFHGTVLVLAPLALILARSAESVTLSRYWRAFLTLGYLLALVVFPFRGLSWLFVPLFIAAIALLIAEEWGTSRT